MKNCLPLLVNIWRVVGLISVTLATGIVIGKFSQSDEKKRSNNLSIQNDKVKSINESADDNQVDEGEEDDQFPDDDDFPRIVFEHTRLSQEDSIQRSMEFYHRMNQRRSVRHISADPVPLQVIENIIKTAGWFSSHCFFFLDAIKLNVVVFRNVSQWCPYRAMDICRHQYRRDEAANSTNCRRRGRDKLQAADGCAQVTLFSIFIKIIGVEFHAGKPWVRDLRSVGTSWVKEYLTEAPWLILIFKQVHGFLPNGKRKIHYYNEISVSIATGFLLAAIQVNFKSSK